MMPGSFLGGAKSRLLPASIPYRFFLAASGFHVLGWLVLLFGADELPGFVGGPGLVLSALHLITLGVLAMTAIGASFQLLPVVTRQPLSRVWPTRVTFWLFTPGVLILAYGMAENIHYVMALGGLLSTVGLLVFALVTVDNLSRAGSLPLVAAHGWAALASLVGLVAAGWVLMADLEHGVLDDHQSLAILHMILAAFGFMGLLVGGLSMVLIPMFVLARSLPSRPGWVQLGSGLGALVAFVLAYFTGLDLLFWLGIATGAVSAGSYLWLMRAAMKGAMRKRNGLAFVVIRVSWVFLGLGVVLAAAVAADAPIPNGPALMGFSLIVGWLLTFLTGVLQRIMPFLASMHASAPGGMPPLLSELTADGPLKVHAVCHFAGLALCLSGIVADLGLIVRAGAAIGLIGALGFAVFAITVLRRLNTPSIAG